MSAVDNKGRNETEPGCYRPCILYLLQLNLPFVLSWTAMMIRAVVFLERVGSSWIYIVLTALFRDGGVLDTVFSKMDVKHQGIFVKHYAPGDNIVWKSYF